MKVSRAIATVSALAIVTLLGGAILRGEPPATTHAADLTFTTPGLPTDRQPERYTASFLDTTLSAMLGRLNVVVQPEDKVYAFPDPSLGVGSTILVYRAQVVTLTDANKTRTVRTWATTVQAFADEQNLDLAEKDIVKPALDQPVPVQNDPVAITVTRVAESQLVINSPVAFSTQYNDDPTLNKGTNITTQAGKSGNLKTTYLVRRVNGVEASRTVIDREQTVAPVPQIVRRGTKPVITVRCKFNDTVIAAAGQNGIDPNALCYRMMAESNGNPNSVGAGGQYNGLFQYTQSAWARLSVASGHSGASIWDATSQIYVTAWAWAHGYRSYWPNP